MAVNPGQPLSTPLGCICWKEVSITTPATSDSPVPDILIKHQASSCHAMIVLVKTCHLAWGSACTLFHASHNATLI